jgi:hypothetical protein
MIDKFLAFFSMAMLVAFILIVAVSVNEIDLWIVVLVVLAMGIFDFVSETRASHNGSNGV